MISLSQIAVYVHWPFCRSICPYCHFNRYLVEDIDWEEWKEALCQEILTWRARLGPREVVSIFFGGGTPSLMKPSLTRSIIQTILSSWKASEDIEITLEMNPNDIQALPGLQEAGINRISMGVQSFRQETLALLGRKHSLEHIRHALSILKNSELRYSFDLIYGHAHHKNISLWQEELAEAILWLNDHISLYQLSYEEGTPFYQKRHEELVDDHTLELEQETEKVLGRLGFNRYEISNYAKPGGQSRHNLMYWRYQDYIGLGPGGCGRISTDQGSKLAIETHRLPRKWLAAVKETGVGVNKEEELSRHQQLCEQLFMGLRLEQGIPLESLFGKGERGSPAFYRRLTECRQQGWIRPKELALTAQGRNLLNSIVNYLCEEEVIQEP